MLLYDKLCNICSYITSIRLLCWPKDDCFHKLKCEMCVCLQKRHRRYHCTCIKLIITMIQPISDRFCSMLTGYTSHALWLYYNMFRTIDGCILHFVQQVYRVFLHHNRRSDFQNRNVDVYVHVTVLSICECCTNF